MTKHFGGKGILAYMLVFSIACSTAPPTTLAPVPAEAYTAALAAAASRARGGDYEGAERILSDYALQAEGSSEAGEISFWRAVYMVDPANTSSSMAEGVRALEIYLATPGTQWYRPQAEVLRRTALTVQTLRQAQPSPRVVGRDTVYVTREEEIATLREQLAKVTADLERIKKRLANPSR